MMACESELENDTAKKHEVVAHRRATLVQPKSVPRGPLERQKFCVKCQDSKGLVALVELLELALGLGRGLLLGALNLIEVLDKVRHIVVIIVIISATLLALDRLVGLGELAERRK